MIDKVVYAPDFVWGIFEYDFTQDVETWNFHSAHWNRERARHFAKLLEKSRIRKIAFQVIEKDVKCI